MHSNFPSRPVLGEAPALAPASSPPQDGLPQIETFDQLISPLSRTEFLSEYWNKNFMRRPGTPGRYQSVLTWNELNTILEQDWLQPPRLRLFQDGKALPRSRYMTSFADQLKLHPGGFTECLAQGATLILDRVDMLAPGVRKLAEACQEAVHVFTKVNLYAGWRTQQGFDLHWDRHDTLILQLSGRKSWKVYRPTRLYPLEEDVAPTPKPTGEPIWEGILEDGDMIYMPRGWWHVACPLDEPSLHLTFGFKPPRGFDFVHWLAGRLRRHAEARMDVPRHSDETARKEYVATLRKLLNETCDDDAFASFLRDWDANGNTRPRISLPHAPSWQGSPMTMETRVRLAAAPKLSFELRSKSDVAHFSMNGRIWSCPANLVPALEALSDHTSLSLSDLCAMLPDKSAVTKLKVLLTSMAMTGVILQEPTSHA